MHEITYRDLTGEGPEPCRELCNRLMQHQAQRARIHREILAAMNYENRLAPSFARTGEKLLLAACDGERPVGYVYASRAWVTEGDKAFRPAWKSGLTPEEQQGLGFYPPSLPAGTRVGELNNLYVLPEYRGRAAGRSLMEKALAWIREDPAVGTIFVYVSNGNDAGDFYERFGFRFSHEVMGGIIRAYRWDADR